MWLSVRKSAIRLTLGHFSNRSRVRLTVIDSPLSHVKYEPRMSCRYIAINRNRITVPFGKTQCLLKQYPPACPMWISYALPIKSYPPKLHFAIFRSDAVFKRMVGSVPTRPSNTNFVSGSVRKLLSPSLYWICVATWTIMSGHIHSSMQPYGWTLG